MGLNRAILGAAALGLISPFATALLHNGSTIAMLLNALRRHAVSGSGATASHALASSGVSGRARA